MNKSELEAFVDKVYSEKGHAYEYFGMTEADLSELIRSLLTPKVATGEYLDVICNIPVKEVCHKEELVDKQG